MGSLLLPGKRAPSHLDAKGGSSGLTSQRNRLHCRGKGVKPALEFSGLDCPATPEMIRPKSQHKSLAQVGSAQRRPTRQPPPRAGSSSAWSGREAALQGCMGQVLTGLVDTASWTWSEAANPGSWPSQGSFLLLHLCEQEAGGPQPRPPAWNPPRKR